MKGRELLSRVLAKSGFTRKRIDESEGKVRSLTTDWPSKVCNALSLPLAFPVTFLLRVSLGFSVPAPSQELFSPQSTNFKAIHPNWKAFDFRCIRNSEWTAARNQ